MNSSFFFILFLILPALSFAKEIPEDVAATVIVNEAADQGFKGMICVAEVLRHRGSPRGFYGYRRNQRKQQPPEVWTMARKAWAISAHTNYTNGADHFENV